MHVNYVTRNLSRAVLFPTTSFCNNGWINYLSWTTSLFTWLLGVGSSINRSKNPSRLKTKLKSRIQERNERSNRFRITKNRLDSWTRFASEVQAFPTEMWTSILMDHSRHEPMCRDVDKSFCGLEEEDVKPQSNHILKCFYLQDLRQNGWPLDDFLTEAKLLIQKSGYLSKLHD